MKLTETQRARVLDHIFVHEAGSSAHLSEAKAANVGKKALRLMDDGHDPATAFELAQDSHGHDHAPAGSSKGGQFVSKGGGDGSDPSEVDQAYSVRPGGFLKRDKEGKPITGKIGSLGEYKPAPHMGEEHAANSKARYEAASKLDPALQVESSPEKPGENLQRVTHADTPEIMRTRHAIQKWEEEWQKEHGVKNTSELDSPDRLELRRDIIDDLYGNGAPKKERKVYLISGPPGSGKSTLVKNQGYLSKHGAIEIDSDMAKEQLPEFNAGRGANLVHEESSGIADSVLKRAMENGDNIVHQIVGKSKAGLMKKIKEFTDAGYSVQVDNLFIEPERSMESVVSRFHRNGRFVPPEYAESVDTHPLAAHNEVQETMKDAPNVKFGSYNSDDVVKAKMSEADRHPIMLAELYD